MSLSLKNNNWVNIKNADMSDTWKGSDGQIDAAGHAIFKDPVYSLRASIRDTAAKHKAKTWSILEHQKKYVEKQDVAEDAAKSIAQRLGVKDTDKYLEDVFDENGNITNPKKLFDFTYALAVQEMGTNAVPSKEEFRKTYDKSLGMYTKDWNTKIFSKEKSDMAANKSNDTNWGQIIMSLMQAFGPTASQASQGMSATGATNQQPNANQQPVNQQAMAQPQQPTAQQQQMGQQPTAPPVGPGGNPAVDPMFMASVQMQQQAQAQRQAQQQAQAQQTSEAPIHPWADAISNQSNRTSKPSFKKGSLSAKMDSWMDDALPIFAMMGMMGGQMAPGGPFAQTGMLPMQSLQNMYMIQMMRNMVNDTMKSTEVDREPTTDNPRRSS